MIEEAILFFGYYKKETQFYISWSYKGIHLFIYLFLASAYFFYFPSSLHPFIYLKIVTTGKETCKSCIPFPLISFLIKLNSRARIGMQIMLLYFSFICFPFYLKLGSRILNSSSDRVTLLYKHIAFKAFHKGNEQWLFFTWNNYGYKLWGCKISWSPL